MWSCTQSDEAARTGRGCALGRPFGRVVSCSSGRGVWKKRLRVKGDVRRGGDLVEGAWFSAVIVLFFIYIYIYFLE